MENFENYGVLEMDAKEMVTTDGGFYGFNWGAFWRGVGIGGGLGIGGYAGYQSVMA